MNNLRKENNTIQELENFLEENKGKWVLFYYTDGCGPSVGSADGTGYENFFLGDMSYDSK